MKRKTYEVINMNACKMSTTYCGVKINMEFKNGNYANNRRASLTTVDPFVQDAIEKDPRFGKSIRLAQSIEYNEKPKQQTHLAVEKVAENEAPKKKRATAPKLKKTAEAESVEAVKSVKNVNDAIDYFAQLGETVENAEQIAELAEKHKVTFPNLEN